MKLSRTSIFLKCAKKLSVKPLPCSRSRLRISRSLIINVLAYFTEDAVVTAAVIAMLVSVSSEPVDDFLVLTPLTLLLSITAEVLSGGVNTLVSTAKIKNKVTKKCRTKNITWGDKLQRPFSFLFFFVKLRNTKRDEQSTFLKQSSCQYLKGFFKR